MRQAGCKLTVISKTVVSQIVVFTASQKTTVIKSLPAKLACAFNSTQLSITDVAPVTAAPWNKTAVVPILLGN